MSHCPKVQYCRLCRAGKSSTPNVPTVLGCTERANTRTVRPPSESVPLLLRVHRKVQEQRLTGMVRYARAATGHAAVPPNPTCCNSVRCSRSPRR
jgi:hypothetical protein